MKLVVGLGNPGKIYSHTRHNIGHWVVGKLQGSGGAGEQVRFLKSRALMNNSGRFVRRLLQRYKLPLENLLVIHDDMDLKLGEVKLQNGRGSAGHKGVQSVIDELETKIFWRLRIGIGKPPVGTSTEEFVLGKLEQSEMEKLEKSLLLISEKIKHWFSSKHQILNHKSQISTNL